MAFLRLLAAVVAVAFSTPAAWAADAYHWCYMQVGVNDNATRYYSDFSYADTGKSAAISIAFRRYVRTNYDRTTGSHCSWEYRRDDAAKARDQSMNRSRSFARIVTLGWTQGGATPSQQTTQTRDETTQTRDEWIPGVATQGAYHWCMAQVGIQRVHDTITVYYTDISYADYRENTAVGNAFREHVRANYGDSPEVHCGHDKTRSDATRQRDKSMGNYRRMGEGWRVVNTRWEYPR